MKPSCLQQKYRNTLCRQVKKGNWLTDKHIDAANWLLKIQFPDAIGLYSPLLGQNMSFPVTHDPCIQILHVVGNHWLTIASVLSSLVHIYDSMYDYVSDDAKMQIAAILHTHDPSVVFKIHKTQFQKGKSDCGVFAIAYATDLCFGNDPASCLYEQNKLRSHFMDCLKSEHLTPFPSSTKKVEKPTIKRISVYCICRLPDNGEEKMIRCNQCREWFHQSCEKVTDNVFASPKEWKCSKCT